MVVPCCRRAERGTQHQMLGGAPARAGLGAPHLVARCRVQAWCSGVWWPVLAGSAPLGFLLAPMLPITHRPPKTRLNSEPWVPITQGPPKTRLNSEPRSESWYWHGSPGLPGTRAPHCGASGQRIWGWQPQSPSWGPKATLHLKGPGQRGAGVLCPSLPSPVQRFGFLPAAPLSAVSCPGLGTGRVGSHSAFPQ